VSGRKHGTYVTREEFGGPEQTSFTLVSCPDCDAPFLLRHHGMDAWDDDGNCGYIEWEPSTVLYPSDPQAMDPAVPSRIANSYLEARRVFSQASAYTAAAIMCRRTLEGICEHFQGSGRTLQARLQDLKTRGVIEHRVHEWVDHALRLLGNDAAHDVNKVISRDDARDALEFTKAILEYLYVFETAFQKFKERRGTVVSKESTDHGGPPEGADGSRTS
jgi:ribosomal protein S27AE